MKRILCIVAWLAASTALLIASISRPRTLAEKVEAADLVVLGIGTAFDEAATSNGEETPTNGQTKPTQRALRIEVKDILWPASETNKHVIVVRHSYVGSLPDTPLPGPCLICTNTPGVFFLSTKTISSQREWRLLGYDDWMEPATNALAVLHLIERQKGKTSSARALRVPGIPYPETTPYDSDSKLRMAYLTAFPKGYFDGIESQPKLPIFAPVSAEDKAKTFGYMDGVLAGENARVEWWRRFRLLMTSNNTPQSATGPK